MKYAFNLKFDWIFNTFDWTRNSPQLFKKRLWTFIKRPYIQHIHICNRNFLYNIPLVLNLFLIYINTTSKVKTSEIFLRYSEIPMSSDGVDKNDVGCWFHIRVFHPDSRENWWKIEKMFSIPPGHFTRRATAWSRLCARWDQWVERPGSCKRLSGIWNSSLTLSRSLYLADNDKFKYLVIRAEKAEQRESK